MQKIQVSLSRCTFWDPESGVLDRHRSPPTWVRTGYSISSASPARESCVFCCLLVAGLCVRVLRVAFCLSMAPPCDMARRTPSQHEPRRKGICRSPCLAMRFFLSVHCSTPLSTVICVPVSGMYSLTLSRAPLRLYFVSTNSYTISHKKGIPPLILLISSFLLSVCGAQNGVQCYDGGQWADSTDAHNHTQHTREHLPLSTFQKPGARGRSTPHPSHRVRRALPTPPALNARSAFISSTCRNHRAGH